MEGVRPEDLPGRLGEEGAALKEPMTLWDAYRARDDKGEFSSYEDKAVMAVGRAGPGWSFAFDGEPAPFPGQRLVSRRAPRAGAPVRWWCGAG